jgi:diguanylate cyclase (GGDEF)-like protein/PAS domain S-box-containing protein
VLDISESNSTTHDSLQPPHILIACEVKDEQLQISKMLNEAGFSRISLADSAQSALYDLNSKKIDLIIINTELPDMDGWRLSRLIRSGILKCRADIAILMRTQTWCERIAEVTAREYGINKLLPANAWDKLIPGIQTLLEVKANLNSKPKLLVIEDSEDTAHLVERVLSNIFEIEIANDGKQGLENWISNRQDLVLLDIMLPGMPGNEILVKILNINPHQPVVVMTAHANAEEAEELMFAGATDFLPKPFRAEQLRKVCDIAIHRDDYLVSTAQFAAQVNSLQEREKEYRNLYLNHHQLLDDLQTIIMELDEESRILFVNQAWQKLTEYSLEETLHRPLSDFLNRDYQDVFSDLLKQIQELKNHQRDSIIDFEICVESKSGNPIWTQLKLSQLHRNQENLTYSICIDDITEKRKSQEQLNYLATHDSLTGLFNRHYCEQHLKQIIEKLQYGHTHALIYIDLDHFKIINDTFGHQRGDDILKEMSQLILKKTRKTDIVCRLGGDEFAIFIHKVTPQKTLQTAQAIQQVINDFSFLINEQRINLGCSIGITMIDSRLEKIDEYFKRADIALYVAKGRGRNLVHFYNSSDDVSSELKNRIRVAQKVRTAILENRLVLFFQPIFDVKENQISHYEALVRLKDKEGNLIFPGEFIPAMESVGEMHILDRWIIKLATQALQDYPQLTNVAINLSAQAFKDESLVPIIVENLNITQVDPGRITFELTESASLFNLQITKDVIRQLHNLGCSFSVDDFGSGFSSFTYLKELQADYIKLDGSFIRNLEHNSMDQALVKSMVQVIQAIGKKAVAEYVESEAILNLLIEMGIDYVQGYYIGHPQPIEQLRKTYALTLQSKT